MIKQNPYGETARSERQDLNLRPPGSRPGTLTGLRYSPWSLVQDLHLGLRLRRALSYLLDEQGWHSRKDSNPGNDFRRVGCYSLHHGSVIWYRFAATIAHAVYPYAFVRFLLQERAMRLELILTAWKAVVLPLTPSPRYIGRIFRQVLHQPRSVNSPSHSLHQR